MITETRMSREFSYMGVKLPDPNPAMTPEEVRQFFATQFPDITTASITGPETEGDKLRYSFTRAIGSKG
jgi:PRTRC genetic system protein C